MNKLTMESIKLSIEYRELTRLWKYFFAIMFVSLLAFMSIFIWLFFSIYKINYDMAILSSVGGFFIIFLIYFPIFIYGFIMPLKFKRKELVRDASKYEIFEIYLSQPAETRFDCVKFLISFQYSENKKIEVMSNWYLRKTMNFPDGNTDNDCIGKKYFIGYNYDKNKVILIKEIN